MERYQGIERSWRRPLIGIVTALLILGTYSPTAPAQVYSPYNPPEVSGRAPVAIETWPMSPYLPKSKVEILPPIKINLRKASHLPNQATVPAPLTIRQLPNRLPRVHTAKRALLPSPSETVHLHHPHETGPKPRPVTLADCVRIGQERQPALKAAYASLAAAETAFRAIKKLAITRLIRPDIPVRRKQACLGITIAQGGVTKEQWETTYAITRHYFTVIYARKQDALLEGVLKSLRGYRKTTKTMVDQGNPNFAQSHVDTLDVLIGVFRSKQLEAQAGIQRALAALREAMGLPAHCPLALVESGLPPVADDLHRESIVGKALAHRGEMVQAGTAADIVRLEIQAQHALRGPSAQTFAAGADVHARPVPQGVSNSVYRPWAVGIEMPSLMVGFRNDRVARTRHLSARADAVVEKTINLISLEATDAFFKWQQAARQVKTLAPLSKKVAQLIKSVSARYNLGAVKIDELLRAQGLEAQVEADYNQALYNHALALAALERITAGALTPSYRRQMIVVRPANGK